MNKLIATGLVCLLAGLLGGCAGASSDVRPVTASASAAAPSQKGARVAFTRGSMSDPEAQQWQADLLHAIGRDGQFELFDYVVVGDESLGDIFVGVNAQALGLTAEQVEAGKQVQQRYRSTKMHADVVDGIWVASAWPEARPVVASNGNATVTVQ